MTRWLFSVKILNTFYLILFLFSLLIVLEFIFTGNEFSDFSVPGISSLVPFSRGEDKPKRLNKLQQSQFSLSEELKQILVGVCLGDLNILKQTLNPCLRFYQGILHEDYLRELYNIFQDYCPAGPQIITRKPVKNTGMVYSSIYFNTYSLPCFNYLYDLFYVGGKKIVPQNIAELISPIGLAFLLCDDGTWNKRVHHVVICTESFTPVEVELLINAFNSKWDLNCYKYKRGKSFRIVIPAKSIPKLQNLLGHHMPVMMRQKIGL